MARPSHCELEPQDIVLRALIPILRWTQRAHALHLGSGKHQSLAGWPRIWKRTTKIYKNKQTYTKCQLLVVILYNWCFSKSLILCYAFLLFLHWAASSFTVAGLDTVAQAVSGNDGISRTGLHHSSEPRLPTSPRLSSGLKTRTLHLLDKSGQIWTNLDKAHQSFF